MNETVRQLPLRPTTVEPPTSDPGDYSWRATSELGEAHAFPPSERAAFRAACDGPRWTAAFGYSGARYCGACIAKLRDALRAVTVALYTAGVRTDVLNHRAVVDYDAPLGAGESVEASRG